MGFLFNFSVIRSQSEKVHDNPNIYLNVPLSIIVLICNSRSKIKFVKVTFARLLENLWP